MFPSRSVKGRLRRILFHLQNDEGLELASWELLEIETWYLKSTWRYAEVFTLKSKWVIDDLDDKYKFPLEALFISDVGGVSHQPSLFF